MQELALSKSLHCQNRRGEVSLTHAYVGNYSQTIQMSILSSLFISTFFWQNVCQNPIFLSKKYQIREGVKKLEKSGQAYRLGCPPPPSPEAVKKM